MKNKITSRKLRWQIAVAAICQSILIFLFLIVSSNAFAAGQELFLAHSENGEITVVVTDAGEANLIFLASGEKGSAYSVDVGPFLSVDKLEAIVTLGPAGEASTNRVTTLAFARGEYRKALQLQALDLVPGIEYSGSLTVSAAGVSPQTWTLKVLRPVPVAELSADVNRATLKLTTNPLAQLFGARPQPAEFLITLTEKSGDIPVTGLTVRRAPGSEFHEGFDLEKDLQFFLDGTEITGLASWDKSSGHANAGLRSIPPGAQRSLKVKIRDLPRGTHKLLFQINAVNAKQDTAPVVELEVNVRHTLLAPALVLLIAIAVSYLLTKGTKNWRQRLKLKTMARALDRGWLEDVRDKPAVVWLRATRRQTLATLKRFSLLPAPEGLTQKLENAMRLLRVIHRYVEIRDQIDSRISFYMLKFRLENDLEKIIAGIEPDQFDTANEATLNAELDALEQCLVKPESRYAPYVEQSQNRVKGLNVVDKLTGIIEPAQKTKIDNLWRNYVESEIDDKTRIEKLMQIDRVCASMRVLKRHLEFGDTEVLQSLANIIARDDPDDIEVEAMFAVTNDAMWSKIKSAVDNNEIEISPSMDRPSATQRIALVPTTFSVVFDDPVLGDTFMAKNRMRSNWAFELIHKAQFLRTPEKPTRWHTWSIGKKLLQFAPASGLLKMSVQLGYGKDLSDSITGELDIAASPAGYRQLFLAQELVLLLVSVVIAFASGLVLYYETNVSFGSMQDYLALFTWGVGVDQGKNLAQTFQSLSAQSKGDSAGD